ncbi:hypothetical protein [Brevibacillus sp. HB2.2]|uniref:hypothetical protein n=1 Tax=Brevibacillus sp. HB2.2 TaxID=2738846 RepID=UPI00156BDB60|nr:hypothetical protein [Brevibacillus sp. HB2.2]NRS51445.1 hypothetical protein [Brevibacillus sp. HB2.2]
MKNCPEASFDILYLLMISQKKYDELHRTEITLLSYLSLLLSIYDGHKSNEWVYHFSHHKFGGPFSSEINNELDLLIRKGTVISSTGEDFYTISNKAGTVITTGLFNEFMQLDRFKWRIKYLDASISACLTKSLPIVSRAINEEPELSLAQEHGIKTTLHSKDSNSLYEQFGALKNAIGDFRNDIFIPASIWIDYLLLLSEKKTGEPNDRPNTSK